MRVINCFDRIEVINLPHRRDRRRAMERELGRLGLGCDPRVSFFKAVRPDEQGDFTSVGARGVYLSQKTILLAAAAAGHSVLILEDDCAFRDGAAEYHSEAAWDIFYGGYRASNPSDLLSSDIIGAHMMGFSARGAQLVSHYLSKLSYQGIHPPIDAAYVWFRRNYPDVATEFAVPPLARQRSSRSDIADLKFYDRAPGFRMLASLARAYLRH
jgi:GR25 family glycosyltransferase involved in LPS biosynthesis